MSLDPFTSSWRRLADLKPRLRAHAKVSRHFYRNQLWYVLQDQASRRVHRFTPSTYLLIGLMDGHRTLQEIWDTAGARLGDEAPSQDDVVRLLSQLHTADVLQCELPPDVEEMLRRHERIRGMKLIQAIMSPLSMRFPLLDPERFLDATLPLYRPLFGWFGALLWFAVVGSGVVLAGIHWAELSKDVTDRALAPENLVLIWLTFPVVKALHEFGHACAVKRWGGEVHEMGIMLLVLMPIPYVDASASAAFRHRYQRAVVGAAGMLVEVFVASLALMLWVNMEPGIARAVAYNVILIAGVSTLLFNINPLLRFDGYYIFSDLIEIPNLRMRAGRYFVYLVQKHLLGSRDQPEPEGTAGEKRWFFFFQIASFSYRIFITFAIVLVIAGKYFVFGVLLAIWSVIGALVLPLAKGLYFLFFSPRLRKSRTRAVATMAVLTSVATAAIFLVPAPMWTRAEGIIWVPEDAIVRPGTEGFVSKVMALPNSMVKAGDAIVRLDEPLLDSQIRVLKARVAQLEAQYYSEQFEQKVRAEITKEALGSAQAELTRALERSKSLDVRAPADGRLVIARADDLPARFVRQGQELAYIVDGGRITVRVVVPQQDIDLVRNRSRSVEVRLVENSGESMPAVVLREVPAASSSLPNLALSVEGGGSVALDPRERNKPLALQKYFQFELELPRLSNAHIGSRVFVRFDHGGEPLGRQWYRRLRQVFLKQLNV